MLSIAFVVLACIAGALGGVHNPRTTQHYKAGEKVIGGIEAAAGEIPWQVSLQDLEGKHLCSGSIISEKWLITAALCSFRYYPENLRVVSGTTQLNSGGSVHYVEDIILHKNFHTNSFENDIALWQINDTFTWSSDISPIGLLPQGTPSLTGTATKLSGWGFTTASGPSSNYLLWATIPIYDLAECNATYSYLGGVPPGQICAGFEEGGADACGDNGGPLYLEGCLHGIMSWSTSCGEPGKPSVYTQASNYRDWITEKSGV